MTGQYERKQRNDVGAKGVAMNSKAEAGPLEPPLMDGNVFE